MSKGMIQKIKNGQADNATFCAIKPVDINGSYVEVEITITEPVYEFQALLKKGDRFYCSECFYLSENDFNKRVTIPSFEFVKLIEESKRIRQ